MRHSLLRGGRWTVARSSSRALWTSATLGEVTDLLGAPPLRRQLEQFLSFACEALPEIERVLVFDDECRQLMVAVSIESPGMYRWDWANA